jgi:ABC-2 type transport system permease protein
MTPMNTAPVATSVLPSSPIEWLLNTWRLTRWYLFAAWRRVMSKVLLGILLGLFVLITGFVVLGFVVTQNSPVGSGRNCRTVPAATQQAGDNGNGGQVVCEPLSPQQEQQIRDQRADAIRGPLTFPGSLEFAGGYTTFMGVILLAILAGAMIGGEFGQGTIRLALSRGVGRAQALTAQVAALAALALGIALGMLLLGALIGVTIGPALGATLPALPAGGAAALLAYWLAVSLYLFAFAAIAFFLATLARSTAAGIAGPLGYLIFELIAIGVLSIVASLVAGDTGDFLRHVPDWFLGQNLSALTTAAFQPLAAVVPTFRGGDGGGGGNGGQTITTAHALLVSLAYCALLVGSTYVIMRRRDVTD